MIVLQCEFLNVFFFSRMNIQMCPQIVYSYKCKVTLTSKMDCLNRFKVLLSEPQYLTHLLLEGSDPGPVVPIAVKGLIGKAQLVGFFNIRSGPVG